jgi:hypothetical protein
MPDQRIRSAAVLGKWDKIDISTVTKEMLSQQDRGRKRNAFHNAAANKKLDKVPKSLWHHDLFLKTDDQANTVLHLAASNKQFEIIPRELLTNKTLTKKNCYGASVLLLVTKHSPLTIIPDHLLTGENLITGNVCCFTEAVWLVDGKKKWEVSEEEKKMYKKNLNIILSKLSEKEMKDCLKNCHDKDLVKKMEVHVDNELHKRKLLSKLKDNYIEI